MTFAPIRSLSIAGTLAAGLAFPALAAPEVGKPAPDFTATTATGETVTLSDIKGQPVILEWTNHLCPYVQKHYGSGNMQALQTEAQEDEIVWLTVISSAPGKQGHVEGAEAIEIAQNANASPTHILLDPSGEIGHLYSAETTPHMYLIDENGTLVFMGGIDDRATSDPADIDGATNYLSAAVSDLEAGTPVAEPVTRPYGCSIKYGS